MRLLVCSMGFPVIQKADFAAFWGGHFSHCSYLHRPHGIALSQSSHRTMHHCCPQAVLGHHCTCLIRSNTGYQNMACNAQNGKGASAHIFTHGHVDFASQMGWEMGKLVLQGPLEYLQEGIRQPAPCPATRVRKDKTASSSQ